MRYTQYSIFGAAALSAWGLGCTGDPLSLDGVSSFRVTVVGVNDADPPTIDAPLPANPGTSDERWDFEILALDAEGNEAPFDGFARIRVAPGAVSAVEGPGAVGRNTFFVDGKSAGSAFVTTVYGPSRLWVEDIGYTPVPVDTPPSCADGLDNDGDGVVDYPADPGCAFADDHSEEGGTFAAGVSDPVHYQLPRIADIQGPGTETPYPFEGVQVLTDDPQNVIVTRVGSDGFYVTDLNGPKGASNSLFAFSFNTPPGMRVCDRLTYLSGTLSEFFGFTEISFPSYNVTFPKEGEGDCEVPDPTVLTPAIIGDNLTMETLESSLVRLLDVKIASFFGPNRPERSIMCDFGWCFTPTASNCDLTGDGQIDFDNPAEAECTNVCTANVECSEWTGFSARGNYKVSVDGTQIQIQTATVTAFDPPSYRGETIESITGTMKNFSGGTLNWTIEARCPDDLVCSFSDACAPEILKSNEACVRLRTTDDPDEATN